MADLGNKGNGSEWTRHSISYHHNLLWQGEPRYRFDERVNHSNVFESQACKSGRDCSSASLDLWIYLHA